MFNSIQGGAAHTWADGDTVPPAFGNAVDDLKFAGEATLDFATLAAWAKLADGKAVVIEPWTPAYDPQLFGGVVVNRGALLWAIDALIDIDAEDEHASFVSGLVNETIPVNTVSVRHAPFGAGTAFLMSTASGGALVMSLAPTANAGTDPFAISWEAAS